jgi:hypothetical protein
VMATEPRAAVEDNLYDLEDLAANSFGKGTVLRLLDANGVAKRRQRLAAWAVQQAIRLYDQSWSRVPQVVGTRGGLCGRRCWWTG